MKENVKEHRTLYPLCGFGDEISYRKKKETSTNWKKINCFKEKIRNNSSFGSTFQILKIEGNGKK